MSKIRSELITVTNDAPCPRGLAAYLSVYNCVKQHDGLIHGRLEDNHGNYCAIGAFFHIEKGIALPADTIDEIAMVNDSSPQSTKKQRKRMVLRFLRLKLKEFGWR